MFISYKRGEPNVPAWIRTHFYPRLSELLDNNSSRKITVFFDENLSGGVHWPPALRSALGRSRILLPVCSPQYFYDEWCLAEWHSMARREKLVGMASHDNPRGLICPVIFCDSANFPAYATDRHMWNLKQWNQPWPQFEQALAYLDFHHALDGIAEELVEVIEQVPAWRPDWPVETPKPGPPVTSRLPRF